MSSSEVPRLELSQNLLGLSELAIVPKWKKVIAMERYIYYETNMKQIIMSSRLRLYTHQSCRARVGSTKIVLLEQDLHNNILIFEQCIALYCVKDRSWSCIIFLSGAWAKKLCIDLGILHYNTYNKPKEMESTQFGLLRTRVMEDAALQYCYAEQYIIPCSHKRDLKISRDGPFKF
jgi:hypothetical protein